MKKLWKQVKGQKAWKQIREWKQVEDRVRCVVLFLLFLLLLATLALPLFIAL